MKKKNSKKEGFTLIELLAVIIILGILMIIAIPSVTEYIANSRKNAYVTTAKQYISSVRNKVNSLEYPFTNIDVVYYVPSKCISLEKGGKSPFGEWKESYVVVIFDGKGYTYYWTSYDSAGYGVILTSENDLKLEDISTGVTSIDKEVAVGSRTKMGMIDSTTCHNEPTISNLDGSSSGSTDTAYETWYNTYTPTAESCFVVSSGAITGMYQREGNVWNAPLCISDDKRLVIPKSVGGVTITTIGNNAFPVKGLEEIILPNGIISLGTRAFAENPVTSIKLPNSLTTIGDNAFFKCQQLTSVQFGNQLQSIGVRAFEELGATEVVLPDSLTTMGTNAFQNSMIQTLIVGSGLSTIPSLAFSGAKINNLTIKNGVTLIDTSAFQYNPITTLTIPNSVVTVGSSAFKECQIATLNLGSGVTTIKNSAFHTNQIVTFTIPSSVVMLEASTFNNNPITSYTIKYNVSNGMTRLNTQLNSAGLDPVKATYVSD